MIEVYMFDQTSRYYDIGTDVYVAPDGRNIKYVKRRFLPPGDGMPLLAEVIVTKSDRLDIIADRLLGDPGQYWCICDANDTMDPAELLYPGLRLIVPIIRF
jgi:hypothetical protein